jgi:excinuclease ABC subunit A
VLYVLDEPSIGLHSQDHGKLLNVIKKLKEQGNTIVIVEHDEDTMRAADYIIEIGPGAGVMGGEVVSETTYEKFLKARPETLTSSFLNKSTKVIRTEKAELNKGSFFSVKNANLNNLKNVDVKFPAGAMIGISGVSGSGKSSLVMDTIAQFDSFDKTSTSFENIDRFKVISKIDQKPIGKTPRSVPATYVGVYQLIRALFTKLPEAQVRGFKNGHFSFNSDLGRCSDCGGLGVKKLGSHFLTDVSVSCTTCGGHRFKPEVLTVQFKGKNISEILNMSIEEAYQFFENQSSIKKKLKTMLDVGLGYIKIGQDSTTLSGGESQRLKLSKELSKTFRGEVLYILDEPTTGLHFQDVNKLIELLSSLVQKGHTVMIIEHQLDLLAQCDHIVDMGPYGGKNGGELVDQGSPEELAKRKLGPTGESLAEFFEIKERSAAN